MYINLINFSNIANTVQSSGSCQKIVRLFRRERQTLYRHLGPQRFELVVMSTKQELLHGTLSIQRRFNKSLESYREASFEYLTSRLTSYVEMPRVRNILETRYLRVRTVR
jgi:hypothetical protein